jgi:hypothetical protein
MGSKLVLLLLLSGSFGTTLFSQDNSLKIRDYEIAKKYTLCKCVQTLYKSYDSLGAYNYDYSPSYFVQMTNFPLCNLRSLDSILLININDFMMIPSEQTPTKKNSNMVVLSCLNFCNSKKFRSYFKNK